MKFCPMCNPGANGIQQASTKEPNQMAQQGADMAERNAYEEATRKERAAQMTAENESLRKQNEYLCQSLAKLEMAHQAVCRDLRITKECVFLLVKEIR